jgi:hypothetical protein
MMGGVHIVAAHRRASKMPFILAPSTRTVHAHAARITRIKHNKAGAAPMPNGRRSPPQQGGLSHD